MHSLKPSSQTCNAFGKEPSTLLHQTDPASGSVVPVPQGKFSD